MSILDTWIYEPLEAGPVCEGIWGLQVERIYWIHGYMSHWSGKALFVKVCEGGRYSEYIGYMDI